MADFGSVTAIVNMSYVSNSSHVSIKCLLVVIHQHDKMEECLALSGVFWGV